LNIKYEKRLVAFIDVLGFKNLVYASTTASIDTYYGFILSNFHSAVTKRNFDFLLISDSIVIYCDESSENLLELMKLSSMLQSGLLAKGIPVRGAISHGDLFVEKANNIIVGVGLINAYVLEAAAKYPRIIVDRSLILKYYGSMAGALAECVVSGLPHLSNVSHNGGVVDYPYLNYGRILSTSMSNAPFEGALNLLKNNFYKNENTEKYEWLRHYLIWAFGEQRKHLEGKLELNQNERSRLRRVTKYIDAFGSL
jgi:hypothetical protein